MAATLGEVGAPPLPEPRIAAARLRDLATKALRDWSDAYGAAYPQLRVALQRVAERHGAPAGRDVASAEQDAARREVCCLPPAASLARGA